MKTIIFSLTFLLFSSLSFSQTQLENNDKSASDFKKSDKKLNVLYRQLMNILDTKKEKDLLVKAEKAWLTYRSAYSKFAESMYDGGSMQASLYFDTMKRLTEARIKQIEEDIDERRPK